MHTINWEWATKQSDYVSPFNTWLKYWEGSAICACDHGCNQFLLKNAAKAAVLFRANEEERNKLAKEDEKIFWRMLAYKDRTR